MAGKLIIFSAPSGAGKSTIINYLLQQNLNLRFSISATSRAPRGSEKNGVEYYFMTPDEFREHIAAGDIFDVDVVGGCNIKKFYGERALSLFIQPPSIKELRKRLTNRGTDSAEVIENRLAKASYELGFATKFDEVIVNDNLEKAEEKALHLIQTFLKKKA